MANRNEFANLPHFDHSLDFNSELAFGAYTKACEFARSIGMSVGALQASGPTALVRGDALVAKWRNLSSDERARIDGVIVGDKRNGPVTVHYRSENQ